MERIRKKIAGLRDKDGQTLAEFWRELPRWERWSLTVILPTVAAWFIFMVVMDVRESGQHGWW